MSATELLDDEWLIVRNSGEIPEITYHASLYHLEKDPLGPDIELTKGQKQYLKDAAVERYHEIILRDIQVENVPKTIYRGVRRTIYNWHRYQAFCARQGLECRKFRQTVATTLLLFLEQGVDAAGESLPEQFLNCRFDELVQFAEELCIREEKISDNLYRYCLTE